jgi:hypothetical protein
MYQLILLAFSLVAAKEETYTVFSFSRKINTCDPADRPLEDTTSKIIWAYNDNDPSPEGAVPKHTDMGSQSVRFFSQGELPPLPGDAVSADVTVGGQTLITFNNPAHPQGSNYWCSTHKIANMFDTKKHLIRFEPIIDSRYVKQVHHIIIYLCNPLTDEELKFSQPCYDGNMPTSLKACLGGELVAIWAVGGDSFDFPSNVGTPFGPTDALYFLMEAHYENPTLIPMYDDSGFRFWFTPTLRQFDAGMGMYGHVTSTQFVIPPSQPSYQLEAWVPPDCTNTYPPEGIQLLAMNLHTHVIGTAVTLQQFRNGVELQPLLEEPYYDFNFQDYTRYVNRTVKILPGDYVRLQCTYNSLSRNVGTPLGLSTSEEMCIAYFIYYPKLPTVNSFYGNFVNSPTMQKMAFCGSDLGFPMLNIPPLSDMVRYVPPPCPYVAPELSRMTPTLRKDMINPSDYEKSKFLDSDNKMTLFWTVDRVNMVFHAAIQAKTPGWVGFGISSFGMEGADVTIGWVSDDNKVNFADRFAIRKAEPPIDALQDYYDISGGQITVNDNPPSSPLLTRTQLYIVGAATGGLLVLIVAVGFWCYQRRKTAPFAKLVDYDTQESIPM